MQVYYRSENPSCYPTNGNKPTNEYEQQMHENNVNKINKNRSYVTYHWHANNSHGLVHNHVLIYDAYMLRM